MNVDEKMFRYDAIWRVLRHFANTLLEEIAKEISFSSVNLLNKDK